MARDPQATLTDVQWVLGRASLTTTQIYVTPFEDDVITGMIAHHARQTEQQAKPPAIRVDQHDALGEQRWCGAVEDDDVVVAVVRPPSARTCRIDAQEPRRLHHQR